MPARTVDTTDAYTNLTTVTFSYPSQVVTLTVLNASITSQFLLVPRGNFNVFAAAWDADEREMIPGIWAWRPEDFGGRDIMGIRIRSTAVGVSARVAING